MLSLGRWGGTQHTKKKQKCLKWSKNDPGWFSLYWVTPPPQTQHVHTHIQTDGDYTKRVVTPFGTTRLKIERQFGDPGSCVESSQRSRRKSIVPIFDWVKVANQTCTWCVVTHHWKFVWALSNFAVVLLRTSKECINDIVVTIVFVGVPVILVEVVGAQHNTAWRSTAFLEETDEVVPVIVDGPVGRGERDDGAADRRQEEQQRDVAQRLVHPPCFDPLFSVSTVLSGGTTFTHTRCVRSS